jgi:hypothetical protein
LGDQVLHKVLSARSDVVYQLALLSSELREIFASPEEQARLETVRAAEEEHRRAVEAGRRQALEMKLRKPIEDDCPICYSELDVEGGEAIVWCEAACGQNFHEACLHMWIKAQGKGTCPLCRSAWKTAEPEEKGLAFDIAAQGSFDTAEVERRLGNKSEGYVNVADQVGVSRERGKYVGEKPPLPSLVCVLKLRLDTSTYSEWWGRRARRGRRGGWRGWGRGRTL